MEGNNFLERVKSIIHDHLDNESFSVNDLADELGLSSSQILRKVKKATGLSVNQLIRELRLEKASQILAQNEEINVSEIAYQVGFSSPSYFIKCFHDKYQSTPGDFRKKGSTPKRKVALAALIGLVITGFIIIQLSLFSNNKFIESPQSKQEMSIAVLPLLDLSKDKDMDYLALGITDAITQELARFNTIRVISRGSSMMFRDSVKLYSEIAEQLGVDLLLEGSLISTSEGLRVIVQLIKSHPKEEHLWANKYDLPHKNVLQLSDQVSYQIAKEINKVIDPAMEPKEKPISNTINPEAYEYYLRGQYLLDQQNPKSVALAIDYAKKAIDLDSGFASSYALLAESYISMNRFIRNNEEKYKNRQESRKVVYQAIDRALKEHGSLSKVYITYGYVLGKIDWDWEGMKTMVNKGLKIDPNNAEGHLLLSDYWAIKGNIDKAISEALLAKILDPLNPRTGTQLAFKYVLNGDYDKALEQYQKVLEIYPNYGFAWDGLGFTYFIEGEKEHAKEAWLVLHEIMGNEAMADYFRQADFDTSVRHWLQEATKTQKLYCSNPSVIAMAFMTADHQTMAMEYLEYAYDLKNEELPITLLHPVFDDMRGYLPLKDMTQDIGIEQYESAL